MDEPMTFLASGPTAFVAGLTNGRGRWQQGFSCLPTRGREALSEMVQRLEGTPDALERLVPRKRRHHKLPAFIPHRLHRTNRQGTMKLARNLGAAASATVFAVDVISEVRRAAGARRNTSSSSGQRNGTGDSPAAARRGGPAKAAPSARKTASPTSKATPTKKAPAKKAPATKKASAAKKAPAKRVAATG